MSIIIVKGTKEEKIMSTLQKIALFLTIIGALNWGLVGLFEFDLVASIFGGATNIVSRVIYAIIAIAGIINIGLLFADIDDK